MKTINENTAHSYVKFVQVNGNIDIERGRYLSQDSASV